MKGRRILLGITGGVAAYKAAALARELVRAGADVRAVLTGAATRFVTPVTLQALTGQTVWTDLWDPRVADNMAHIELSRDRELIVVAPASADFIGKLANGLCDDLLSALVIARDCGLMLAPAMNRQMWEHPAVRRNMARLREDGVLVVGPEAGEQACGETGMGRMLEPAEIVAEIEACFQPKLLAGRRVLVTAGPTEEAIDPVRVITNTSSGKMGYAVARACAEAGAQVTLVSGPTALAVPRGVARVPVRSADEMFAAVRAALPGTEVFVAVAAVADYRVRETAAQKIKKGGRRPMSLALVENPDILGWVASRPRPPFCIGFAAESENLAGHAEAKRRRKRLPLLAGNLVQQALGADESEITLFDDAGAHLLARAPKLEQARRLVAHFAPMLRRRR